MNDVIIRALCVSACRWHTKLESRSLISGLMLQKRARLDTAVGRPSAGRCKRCPTCTCTHMHVSPEVFPRSEKRRGDDRMGGRKCTSVWWKARRKTRGDTRRPIKVRLEGGGAVCVCVRERSHVYHVTAIPGKFASKFDDVTFPISRRSLKPRTSVFSIVSQKSELGMTELYLYHTVFYRT